MNAKKAIIEVNNISKIYQKDEGPLKLLKNLLFSTASTEAYDSKKITKALSNVSFNVERGESLGIVGLNGSGKSTILQIISGILQPTAGSVNVNGRILSVLELGAGFNPDFTGIENIYLNSALYGIDQEKTTKILKEILDFAEIGDHISQPLRTYSSGMIVRLAFGILSSIEAEILIIDEALAVGDAYFQAKCMNFLNRFRSKGGTLIMVSHDTQTHSILCSKILILDNGNQIKFGNTKETLELYNSIIAKNEPEYQITRNNLELRSGTLELKFISKQLLDISGKKANIFFTDDYCKIEMEIQSFKDIDNPTVGFLIKDIKGIDIFGTNTNLSNFDTGKFRKSHKKTISVSIKLELCPGIFTISLAVHDGKTHLEKSYDWSDNAFVFEIKDRTSSDCVGISKLKPSFSIDQNSHHKDI